MRFPSKSDCLKLLKRAGLDPATVIDVGVHEGTADLMAAFPGAHHLLVEPEAAHAAAIARAYRDIPHTRIAAAASDRDGDAVLTAEHRDGGGAVTHSRLDLLDERPDAGASSAVRLARLDTLVIEAGVSGPFVLKIDTDGHELEVLAGAPETLKHCAVVVVEATLSTLGARLAPLDAAGLRLFDIVDLAYYYDTLSQVDLVFVNPAVFDPAELDPWRSRRFAWRAWRPLLPWTSVLDPVRRLSRAVQRKARQVLHRLH